MKLLTHLTAALVFSATLCQIQAQEIGIEKLKEIVATEFKATEFSETMGDDSFGQFNCVYPNGEKRTWSIIVYKDKPMIEEVRRQIDRKKESQSFESNLGAGAFWDRSEPFLMVHVNDQVAFKLACLDPSQIMKLSAAMKNPEKGETWRKEAVAAAQKLIGDTKP